jgi:hypothetical protein
VLINSNKCLFARPPKPRVAGPIPASRTRNIELI